MPKTSLSSVRGTMKVRSPFGCAPFFSLVFFAIISSRYTTLASILYLCALCFLLFTIGWWLYCRFSGRRANKEWKAWVSEAQANKSFENLPVLKKGSKAQSCLVASIPPTGRTDQYALFQTVAQASDFHNRHSKLIIRSLREKFEDQTADSRLAIGLLETNDGMQLLLFRQMSQECALFFTVLHRRNGKVIDLITHRWALHLRDEARREGRRFSDEHVASVEGPTDQERWRARPEWGVLGYWHLVDCICRRVERNNSQHAPQLSTAVSDSELNYYEKIVHTDTIKELSTNATLSPEKSKKDSRQQSDNVDDYL